MECYISYLNGHQGDVTCLSSYGKLLASSSEDSTVRIWDMSSQKSIRRLTDPLYFPGHSLENISILEHSVFVSTSSSIFEFDIRSPSKIIHSESESVLSIPEEISTIDQNTSNLIISTDDGEVLIIDKASKETRARSSPHSNVIEKQLCCAKVICEDLVVSGGFDSRVMLTGLHGETISGCCLEDLFPSQGFNPPHVYAVSCRGREAALALGNGNVCLFEYREALTGTLNLQAHQQRVMALALAKFEDIGISADVQELSFWKKKPNYIETAHEFRKIFVADTSCRISVFEMKVS